MQLVNGHHGIQVHLHLIPDTISVEEGSSSNQGFTGVGGTGEHLYNPLGQNNPTMDIIWSRGRRGNRSFNWIDSFQWETIQFSTTSAISNVLICGIRTYIGHIFGKVNVYWTYIAPIRTEFEIAPGCGKLRSNSRKLRSSCKFIFLFFSPPICCECPNLEKHSNFKVMEIKLTYPALKKAAASRVIALPQLNRRQRGTNIWSCCGILKFEHYHACYI